MSRKIVVIGASLATYARNKNLLTALRSCGEVTIIPTPTPQKPYRFQFIGTLLKAIWQAWIITIPKDTGFVVVLFPDNENMWTARVYRWLYQRKYKIVFDPFISIYDTYVYNKPLNLISKPVPVITPLLLWWLKTYERSLFNSADILLTDTTNHGQYLQKLLGLKKPMSVVLIGADEEQFQPSELDNQSFWQKKPLQVLWYGKVSLMHGVDYIIAALQLLSGTDIRVTLVGDLRQFSQSVLEDLTERGVLIHIPEVAPQYVGQAKLRELIQTHPVALGMFGRTDKSHNVITNKEYEAWACGRALVTIKADREFITHERNCLMVDTSQPQQLADALQRLAQDRQLLQRLAQQGQRDYEHQAAQTAITQAVKTALQII